MSSNLSDWIATYTFSPGRREFSLRQVAEIASGLGLTEIVADCELAIAHERELHDLQRRYRGEKVNPQASAAAELDPVVDRTVGAIFRVCGETASTLDGSVADAARRIVAELFPRGAVAITNLSFVEQGEEIASVLRRLQDDADLAPAARDVGIAPFVTRLAHLNQRFQAALSATPPERIGADQVRAAVNQGQDNLLGVIAQILGRYPKATAEHAAARAKLLAPIWAQNQAIRAYLRIRRRVRDVDPVTGQETPAADDTGDPTLEPAWHAEAHEHGTAPAPGGIPADVDG